MNTKHKKIKSQTNISYEYGCKISTKSNKLSVATYEINHRSRPSETPWECQVCF
jgi:hypothetical protein